MDAAVRAGSPGFLVADMHETPPKSVSLTYMAVGSYVDNTGTEQMLAEQFS